jgi:hypothetical protein
MTLNGNNGTLGVGDFATRILSQRFAGAFPLLSDLTALPEARRADGMMALVLSDGGLWFFDADSNQGHLPDDGGSGSWLPVRTTQMLYDRSLVFAVADLKDDDGFVESVATVTDPATFTGSDLDGALVVDDVGMPPRTGIAFWPSVTSDSSAGAFAITEDFEFVGTYNGEEVTRLARLVEVDGGETIIADGPLETLTTINAPAMADTDGALTFGFSGIGPVLDANGNEKAWTVVSNADAANADTAVVHVAYADGSDNSPELAKGMQLLAKPVRIYADSTAPITIYE